MNKINNIYSVNYMKDRFSFIGLLRNEKLFNINDKIFFSTNGHDIYCSRIIGVELPPAENPEYKYKIEIPEQLIKANEELPLEKIELNCEWIFFNINEAKESAYKNLDRMAKLQAEEIERYFGQFEQQS